MDEYGKKGKVTLYMDLEIVREAKDLGLNVAKIAENALKEAIRRLKGEDCEVDQGILHSHSSDFSESGNKEKAPGVGFEPTRPDWATSSQGHALRL